VDRIGILDCYKLPSVETENLATSWCIIAVTRHCLVMDWLPISSSTWFPKEYFTFKSRVDETALRAWS